MADEDWVLIDRLAVPVSVFQRCPPFALDIGGSCIKVICKSLQHYKNNGVEDAESELCDVKYYLDLFILPIEKSDILLLILERYRSAFGTGASGYEAPLVFSTGIAVSQLRHKLENELQIRIENLDEFSCFVRGFLFVLTISHLEPVFCAIPEKIVNDVLRVAPDHIRSLATYKVNPQDTYFERVLEKIQKRWDQANHNGKMELLGLTTFVDIPAPPLPCLLVVCGSSWVFIQVDSDGSQRVIDTNTRGKLFTRLGNLLTGKPEYDDLCALAKDGDSRQVDVTMEDLKQGSQTDLYNVLPDTQVLYGFGKAHQQSAGADLASALLRLLAEDVVQIGRAHAHATNYKNVFFCGSFFNSDIVREYVTREFLMRNLRDNPFKRVHYHIIKRYCHLGALGAMLHEMK